MAGTDNYFPGTQVIERPFQPARQAAGDVPPDAVFIGLASQGPLTPTGVSTWSQFVSLYGTSYTDLHYAVNDFFASAGVGRVAHVQRIPGNSAVSATVTVLEAAGGTPPTLFTVTASNPGAWGNDLKVVLTYRTVDRFDMALYKVPSTVTFDATKRNSDFLLEQWLDLSLDPSDSRYMYDLINSAAAAGSAFITVSGTSWDPATPGTRPMPVTSSAVVLRSLATGANGTTPTGVTTPTLATTYTTALGLIDQVRGPFVLNLPNVTDGTIIRNAVTYAAGRGDIFVIIDPPSNTTAAGMVTYVDTTLAITGTSTPSYAAVYYPWLYLPAVGAGVSGKTTLRPPGGAVAGVISAIDATDGVWRAPAGYPIARVGGATELERQLTDADLTTLNNKNVNAVRSIPGVGIVVMGARTLKRTGLDMYVNNRRSIIYLRDLLRRETEFALFSPNNERLWSLLAATCSRILNEFWQSGGLRGTVATEAFYVKCDADNNVPSTAAGQVNVEVGIALSEPAEFIVITIGHFDGASVVNSSV